MRGILVIVFSHCIIDATTQDSPCSSFPLPTELYFKETSKAGSILFVSNKTNSTTQEWRIDESNPRVALNFENQTYQFTLQSEVNLDVISVTDKCNSQLQEFAQRITCNRPGEGPTDKVVTFHVLPVNEYTPEFSGDDRIYIIEGNKTTPYFIERLFDRFIDKDCPKEHINLNIINSAGSESDASEYFMINKTSGFLFQIKTFEYEDTSIQCQLGKGGGTLNITAEDGVHVISKVLNVTFVNVDDSPPVFVNAGCSTTCYTCPVSALTTTVNYSYMGIIITFPPKIKAVDPDSTNVTIMYHMEVCPEKYKDNIVYKNGTFILQSFSKFAGLTKNSDFKVMVILQAIGSNGQKSDRFELTINVKVPPTLDVTSAFTTDMTSTSTPSGMTSEIPSKKCDDTFTVSSHSPSTATLNITSDMMFEGTTDVVSHSTKDIIIVVLATLVGIFISVGVVIGIYKLRMTYQKTKTIKGENSYEEVSGNNETKENIYATINHYASVL